MDESLQFEITYYPKGGSEDIHVIAVDGATVSVPFNGNIYDDNEQEINDTLRAAGYKTGDDAWESYLAATGDTILTGPVFKL